MSSGRPTELGPVDPAGEWRPRSIVKALAGSEARRGSVAGGDPDGFLLAWQESAASTCSTCPLREGVTRGLCVRLCVRLCRALPTSKGLVPVLPGTSDVFIRPFITGCARRPRTGGHLSGPFMPSKRRAGPRAVVSPEGLGQGLRLGPPRSPSLPQPQGASKVDLHAAFGFPLNHCGLPRVVRPIQPEDVSAGTFRLTHEGGTL